MVGLYLFIYFQPAVRWRPPYLDLIAYPAIYPFWLIPVQLKTSRRHHFLLPIHRYIYIYIYMPFPSLSRLKRMGAGLVMFTIHADTSMKSAGGPCSAWSSRLWCLLTIYFAPGAPAYHIGLEILRGTGSSGWILPNFISWPNHDGQWFSQTWAGIKSLSPFGTDGSLSFITVRLILEL